MKRGQNTSIERLSKTLNMAYRHRIPVLKDFHPCVNFNSACLPIGGEYEHCSLRLHPAMVSRNRQSCLDTVSASRQATPRNSMSALANDLIVEAHSFYLAVTTGRASKMAYYGTNGYGDDGMDTESSGPKVTVREVRI